MSTGQKHAFWCVPDYDGTGSGNAPATYLRLGSATSSVGDLSSDTELGDDLLEAAGLADGTSALFMDDDETTNRGQRDQAQAGTRYWRADGHSSADTWSPTELTAQLRSASTARGGWRDHTDGNRISTTRGDRVDVVFGNYLRVVFGRVDAADGADLSKSTWESSGGHNHDSTSTPGEVTTIQWVRSQSGTWQVVEDTVKGHEVTHFSGKRAEYFDGDELESTTGVDPDGDDATDLPKTNPVIEEYVYAGTVESTTDADSITEETQVETEIYDDTTVCGTYESKLLTPGGTVRSSTGTAGSRVSTFQAQLYADTLTIDDFFVMKTEVTTGGTYTTNFGSGFKLTAGMSLEVNVGATFAYRINCFQLGCNLALQTSLCMALDLGVLIGAKIEITGAWDGVGMSDAQLALIQAGTAAKDTEMSAVEKLTSAFRNMT